MGNSIRWTPEQLADYERRGKVTTHRIEKNSRPGPPIKRSKYGNIKAEADGMIFASKRERGRWMDLRLEEREGAIKSLKRQVVYPLTVNGLTVCDYIADFVYERGGELVVEDSKGYRTDMYRLKAKLMLAVHGVTVLET